MLIPNLEPIYVKCAIANDLKLEKMFYCCYECMRDNEMISAVYPFKCVTRYDNEEYICYLNENDKIQDVVPKFMETILGDKFQPSKDYSARVVHRGKLLCPVDKIFPIFSKTFDNNVTLFFAKTNKRNYKLIFKSNELSQKNSKTTTIDDVKDKMI